MTLPAKYFYDEEGSRLFEAICETPEYYVTRTERGILERCARDLADRIGPDVRLVELGSGASTKTRILLDNWTQLHSYEPVDISADFLRSVADQLQDDYPSLKVSPVVADYSNSLDLPESEATGKTVVFFPGSSIGNFHPDDARALLGRVVSIMRPDGLFLIGIDRVKDTGVLNAAYNDADGVTRAFNLNMLNHLNALGAATFRVDDFEHRAFFNSAASRIEMHLDVVRETRVNAGSDEFVLAPGDSIRTEVSYKYTIRGFEDLARSAGLRLVESWSDDREWFSILLLKADPHA